jgi:hypothetical protein
MGKSQKKRDGLSLVPLSFREDLAWLLATKPPIVKLQEEASETEEPGQ